MRPSRSRREQRAVGSTSDPATRHSIASLTSKRPLAADQLCNSNSIAYPDNVTASCAHCGFELPPMRSGPTPKYCSDRCRKRSARHQPYALDAQNWDSSPSGSLTQCTAAAEASCRAPLRRRNQSTARSCRQVCFAHCPIRRDAPAALRPSRRPRHRRRQSLQQQTRGAHRGRQIAARTLTRRAPPLPLPHRPFTPPSKIHANSAFSPPHHHPNQPQHNQTNNTQKEWEHYYNYHRPHGGLNGQTPYERLRQKTQTRP